MNESQIGFAVWGVLAIVLPLLAFVMLRGRK